jgi:sulfur carrier protein
MRRKIRHIGVCGLNPDNNTIRPTGSSVQATKPHPVTSQPEHSARAPRDVVVNGAAIVSRAATLAELLAELGYSVQRVATARNGEFVAERLRATTVLDTNDRIEIVAPRQGG